MFEKLNKMSQAELVARKAELEQQIETINDDVKANERQLRKHLWWLMIIPFFGWITYYAVLGHRRRAWTEVSAGIDSMKFKQSQLQLELMKIDTMIIKEK
jgi:hypothetical protein